MSAIVSGLNTVLIFVLPFAFFCCGPFAAAIVFLTMVGLTVTPLFGHLVVVDESVRRRRRAAWIVGAIFLAFVVVMAYSILI